MRSNSVSSRFSAAEFDPEPSMQLFVKDLSGQTFPLTIPESATIGSLKSLLALRTNLAVQDLRLVYAGKHLSCSSDSLTDCSLRQESTLQLATPLRGGIVPTGEQCGYEGCKKPKADPAGYCEFCNQLFCISHRLIESHEPCEGFEKAKTREWERNRARLEREKTKTAPITGI